MATRGADPDPQVRVTLQGLLWALWSIVHALARIEMICTGNHAFGPPDNLSWPKTVTEPDEGDPGFRPRSISRAITDGGGATSNVANVSCRRHDRVIVSCLRQDGRGSSRTSGGDGCCRVLGGYRWGIPAHRAFRRRGFRPREDFELEVGIGMLEIDLSRSPSSRLMSVRKRTDAF